MDEEALARAGQLYAARRDFFAYAKNCLRVINKEGSVVPLVMNRAQQYIHKQLEDQLERVGYVRAIILKGRQQGASTYIEARFYWRVSGEFGKHAFILTHRDDATENLFNMTKRYNDNCPVALRPHTKLENAKELFFDKIDSRFSVATAGGKETGRGGTGQFLHGCLSPETWIANPRGGLRRMGDFEIGDLVYTHTGETAAVSGISYKRANAYAVRVMSANEPIIATAEHKFITRHGKKRLDELNVGDELMHPVVTLGNEPLEWPYRLDYGRRAGRGGAGSVGPDTLKGDFLLGRVLGLYLAEGHVRCNRVSFAVHEREVIRTIEWLKPFLECWRSVPKIYPRATSKTVTVEVNSKSFAYFVEKLCGRVAGKHMPNDWHRNAEFAHGLVVGYFSGDGGGQFSTATRRVQAPSIRNEIAFPMRDALAALGYGWASLVRREGAVRGGRHEKTQWTVRLSGEGSDRLWAEMGREPFPRIRGIRKPNFKIEDGAAWFPITEIEPIGEVDVMDFEVAHDDHSYRTWQCATSNSEAAFWANASKHMAGIAQVIPMAPGTEIILESTGNGIGNYFHQTCLDAMAGKSDYIFIFTPWFWSDEYQRNCPADTDWDDDEIEYQVTFGLNDRQLYWRRMKIRDEFKGDTTLFDQEYPATPEMAFLAGTKDSLISPMTVARACYKREIADVDKAAIVIGIDPAEYGDDESSFTVRQGRKVTHREDHIGEGNEQIAGRAALLIEKFKPDAVNVDVTGVGTGVEAFLSAAYRNDPTVQINRVHFGGKAIESDKYARRADEMYGRMKDWLLDEPVSLPDDDARLKSELTSRKYKYDASRRLVIESKEDMKKRGLKSPGRADSLALTFAVSIAPRQKAATETIAERLRRLARRQRQSSSPGMGA